MIWQSMSQPAWKSLGAPARIAFLALGCLTVISSPVVGQSQLPPESPSVIRKQVNLVLVDVAVTDSKGHLISGLKESDFELLDEGVEQKLTHFSQDEIPLAIALVIDVSGSMRPILEPVRNALVRALPTLKAEDRVVLFSFSRYCRLEIGLTNDFAAIARRIVKLHSHPGTNVDDALAFATKYLHEQVPSGRRVIFLLSDMVSREGTVSDYQVEQGLIHTDIGLFGIRSGYVPMDLRDKRFKQVDADHIAKTSGGYVMDVPHPRAFEAATESLIKFLKSRYTLGFSPASFGKPGAFREIKVLLKDTKGQKELSHAKLNYRLRYQVPSDAPAKSP
jgi:VWFA-related protein